MTRDQLLLMWHGIRRIEHAAGFLKSPPTKQTILWEVQKIKDLIQEELVKTDGPERN